jgi:hypothetical protein
MMLAAGCDQNNAASFVKEPWDPNNDPSLISGDDYKAEFSALPLKGDVNHRGWSDDYWPTYRGGISYRWLTDDFNYKLINLPALERKLFRTQSPAEKYDILMDRDDFPTVKAERGRTQVFKTVPDHPEFVEGFEIPAWEGLCHGWAPAAHNFKEPQKMVRINLPRGNQVVFYPSDIKALLTYYQQYPGNRSTSTYFMSERCNANFKELDEKLAKNEITYEEWERAREIPECRDMNAGSFHLLLTNEIGLKQEGFIADVTRDTEVWNQPVNSYRSEVLEQKEGASEGAAPGTVKEVTVRTRMSYTVEYASQTSPLGSREKTTTYEYALELDKDGKIIGGRWISEDHPDFAWRESKPEFMGYFLALKKLYNQSL